MIVRLSTDLKIILVIILVILVVIIALGLLIQLPRYWRLKDAHVLRRLDEERPFRKRQTITKDKVVVTMSTIPDRIHLIGPTLASLLDQTCPADEIAINVPQISRKGLEYHIPGWLKSLQSVTIHRVDVDEGPATKLLPTLRRERPGTRIIAVDDDNIYNTHMIEHLLKEFERRECQKNRIALTNYGFHLQPCGQLPPMSERIRAVFAQAEEVDLLQGFSGFLVLPEFFPKEAFSIANCPKECISVDDIWFTGWLCKNHVRIETSGSIYCQIPIINFGKMRETTSLAHGENKDFVTDQIVINWFIKDHGFRPVLSK